MCQPSLRVVTKWVNVDPFHRAPLDPVILVHSTTSARLSQRDPVGGLITSTAKLRVDQRLQEQRAIAVEVFPVRR